MNASIGYFEAWADWFTGEQLNPQSRMLGIPILAWGRAGKVAAFIGGATVVLEIIGPDRLKASANLVNKLVTRSVTALTVVYLIFFTGAFLVGTLAHISGADDSFRTAATVLGVITVFVALPLTMLGITARHVIKLAETDLNRDQPGQGLRILGFLLLIAGFHFDLLAS